MNSLENCPHIPNGWNNNPEPTMTHELDPFWTDITDSEGLPSIRNSTLTLPSVWVPKPVARCFIYRYYQEKIASSSLILSVAMHIDSPFSLTRTDVNVLHRKTWCTIYFRCYLDWIKGSMTDGWLSLSRQFEDSLQSKLIKSIKFVSSPSTRVKNNVETRVKEQKRQTECLYFWKHFPIGNLTVYYVFQLLLNVKIQPRHVMRMQTNCNNINLMIKSHSNV